MAMPTKRKAPLTVAFSKRSRGDTLGVHFERVNQLFKKTIPQLLLRRFKAEYIASGTSETAAAEAAFEDVADVTSRAPSCSEEDKEREMFIGLARRVELEFPDRREGRVQGKGVCCGIVIMLRYALTLSEPTDELILDMQEFLTELFTVEEARCAYDTIIEIASRDDLASQSIRRTILFGS